MRDRLAAGLRPVSTVSADLVLDPRTTVEPVDADWLGQDWVIYDVTNKTPPRPRRFLAALGPEGAVTYLTGKPAAFDELLSAVAPDLDAESAVEVAETYLDTTRDFRTLSYRVDDVEDIRWRPTLTGAQQQAKDDVVQRFGDRLADPTASRSGDGWLVRIWTVTGTSLVRHDLTVGTGADDDAVTVATNLPVPASN